MKVGSTALTLTLVLALCATLVGTTFARPEGPERPEKPVEKVDTAGEATTKHQVAPEYYSGNPVCSDFGPDWIEAKFDVGAEEKGFANGDFDVEGGTISVSGFDGKYFDFSSTMPMSAVFVKAGNGGNLFDYEGSDKGPQSEDEGLHSPVAPNGNVREVSHVTFCWNPSDASSETAFAYDEEGDVSTCFLDIEDAKINRWGWTNGPIGEGEYSWGLYAGAAQCDTSKGKKVGSVTVKYEDGTAVISYDLDSGYTLKETHVYVGSEQLPLNKKGDPTVAPGSFPYTGSEASYTVEGLTGEIYVIAHAVVSGAF